MTDINYQRSIVTFIDVLGFRHLVESQPADRVAAVVNVLRRATDADYNGALKDESVQVVAFSDSVIRIARADFPSQLFYELLTLVHAHAQLAQQGVFIRGGMTLGDVATSPSGAFGPGFNEAYMLESKFALYPRIVLSPALLRAHLNGDLPIAKQNSPAQEDKYLQELLDRGDDGMWFIDYLRAFESEVDTQEAYVNWLNDHAGAIANLANALKAGGKSLSSEALKVNWLANYHNRVADELGYKQVIHLDEGKLPAGFTFTR